MYANGDGVNMSDPSGHMSLADLQVTMFIQMQTVARYVSGVLRVYNFINSVADSIAMVTAVGQIVANGDLTHAFEMAKDAVAGDAGKFTPEKAAQAFADNVAQALPYAASDWAPKLMADMTTGTKVSAFLIFLPNWPVSVGKKTALPFKSGLKVAGKPVEFVFGGIGSGRLAGIGFQTTKNKKETNRLFFRMDHHLLDPGHGHKGGVGTKAIAQKGELCDPWEDGPFHFHVMKYENSF